MEVLNVLNLCGGHSHQCIHYFGCKKAVNSAIFHLCCTFIQGQLIKRKKTIYTLQRHFKTWCLFLSMIDMYRSLALLCNVCMYENIVYKVLTANYYADFYRSLSTAVSYRMKCKLLLSYLLHYLGVLVFKIRNNYYKYVRHYKYHISICVDR